jgi:demethylmenaquinone methyltransferase/2-methoxy-6-polyprenyl-1,4-benzoquinol methylase
MDHAAVSRVTRSKEEARASYDRLSRWYDALGHASEWPFTARGLRMLRVHAGETVLEIGCGTGHALVALSQEAGHVCGLDLSAGMLAVAQERLRKAGAAGPVHGKKPGSPPGFFLGISPGNRCWTLLTERGIASRSPVACGGEIHLVQGDATHLPYAAASFDAVFMSFTLELFDTPEIPVVLAACRRVLRPGGRLGVVALAQADNLAVRLYEWAHRRFPRAVDCRPIQAPAALQAAGFQISAHQQGTMWGLPVDMVVAGVVLADSAL